MEKKRRKEEKWGMVRWLSNFININCENLSKNGGAEKGKRKLLEQSGETNPMEIFSQWVGKEW